MNGREIDHCAREDEFLAAMWSGVFASNDVPSLRKLNSALIVNFDPSNLPGSHWVAVFRNRGPIEYFDSFGQPPPKDIFPQLARNCIYNSVAIQGDYSSACGHHSLTYIMLRARGFTMEEIIGIYDSDTDVNDTSATAFICERFELGYNGGYGNCQTCSCRVSMMS